MKRLIFLSLIFITSCQSLPQLYQTAEDIANDTAIEIEISRQAFQKETDLSIMIQVQNKDEPTPK